MKRFRLRDVAASIALAFAGLAILVAPASAVVLNNGLIVVHNTTDVPVVVEMLTLSGHTWEGTTLAPGHTFMTERCCYAAGTQYRLYVHFKGGTAGSTYFYPRLCNNGIPYGFAEFNAGPSGVHRTPRECY